MSNNNGSRLQRSEEMGVEGDSLLKSLIDEIQNLRGIVNPLKQEVKMLQDQLAESGKLIKDKFSIVDLYDSPDYKDQKFNVAAMTIILHKKNAQEWQRADLEDCHQIFERIHDDAHYLGFAKTKERIVNKDGSLSNSFLMVLRLNFNHFTFTSVLVSLFFSESIWSWVLNVLRRKERKYNVFCSKCLSL